jgi:ornithine--oxo-acid transaminase
METGMQRGRGRTADAHGRARNIHVIAAACGLGAPDSRCGEGPEHLLATGLVERLEGARSHEVLHCDASGRPRDQAIAEFCARLSAEVEATVTRGAFPLVLGGDHSCAIGTWTGAARALSTRGAMGLVWIDAHMDSHTRETSHSGMIHGMPLAVLLGRGGAPWPEGSVRPEHVCVIGVRSFEAEEAALLDRLGVRVFGMEEIVERGLDAVLSEAISIAAAGTAGYGVTLDIDAVDPEDAPGAGSLVPGGIPAAGLVEALKPLANDPGLVAIEIAEYNPYVDRRSRTRHVIEQALGAMLSQAGTQVPGHAPMDLEERYGARNYDPLPVVLVRGKGPYVWDSNGRRHIDMMSAYSAVSHGHAHPRLLAALTRQAQRLAVTSRAFHNDQLPAFLERLCELTGMERALPLNTGAEAVETAIKATRKWAYDVKGVPPGRAEIIACEGNFHGRSNTVIAMSTDETARAGFGPYAPGFRIVPYGDADALEHAIGPHTAAFFVEPIQGERGIVCPPPGYLAQCARICRENNVLFVADEVQTGLGRTGRMLACDHENVRPDALMLGKALGGGLLPVSAFLARSDVMDVFTPGSHGSTFGGNPLASAVALEALNVLVDERLPQRAARLGPVLMAGLEAMRSPLVREVRGRGLLVGVELAEDAPTGRQMAERLLAQGILTKETHGQVLRFAPPLVIRRRELHEAIERIGRALEARGDARRLLELDEAEVL